MPGSNKTTSPTNWPKPSDPLPTSRGSMTAPADLAFQPKLSPSAVQEIRKLARQAKRLAKKEGRKTLYLGFTRSLAERHGVTMRCIQLIIKGQRQTGKKAGRPKASS
jgi:hypothetical protein